MRESVSSDITQPHKVALHSVMVSSFDDPILWEGHASMISEIRDQLPQKPDAIFCSVGGGGLLGGIIVGCRDVGWDDSRRSHSYRSPSNY